MKFGATLLAFSSAVATVYGVLFSITYPRVEIDGGMVTLCALCGLLTCLAAVALWKLAMGSKS